MEMENLIFGVKNIIQKNYCGPKIKKKLVIKVNDMSLDQEK